MVKRLEVLHISSRNACPSQHDKPRRRQLKHGRCERQNRLTRAITCALAKRAPACIDEERQRKNEPFRELRGASRYQLVLHPMLLLTTHTHVKRVVEHESQANEGSRHATACEDQGPRAVAVNSE